jgi:hypothetical protein
MQRASVIRALLALLLAVAGVGLVLSQAGMPIVAGAIGVRVGSPWAWVELTRAVVPVIVAVSFAALAIRFGIRALRKNVTARDDFARGGKLLDTTIWAAWVWLVVELLYRQQHLGWATLFGNVARSLVWSSVVVALVVVVDRLVPWSRAPRGVRHVGLAVVAIVALLAALSAWSHRNLVPPLVLAPIALLGLALLTSGVARVERGPRLRTLVELGLASALLAGPIWRFFT